MNQYVYGATQQKWFVNVKKDEYSEWECKAMFDELERAGLNEEGSDLDAIEALFKHAADEAEKARSMIMR